MVAELCNNNEMWSARRTRAHMDCPSIESCAERIGDVSFHEMRLQLLRDFLALFAKPAKDQDMGGNRKE